jgi:hypothetical protein
MSGATQTAGRLWTDTELAVSVDAYVFLLGLHHAGLSYPRSRAEVLLLEGPLSNRNDVALRYRMRNISAVVAELGGPTLPEYSPAEQVGTKVRARLRDILTEHPQFQRILTDSKKGQDFVRHYTRADALDRLEILRARLLEIEEEVVGIGIGHNRPPEPIAMTEIGRVQFDQAREAIQWLKDEIQFVAPNHERVPTASSRLAEFGLKLALWAGERATKFTDVTLKILAPVIVAKVTGLAPLIVDALRAVADALGR